MIVIVIITVFNLYMDKIRTCRKCGITSDKIKFHSNKNLCKDCYNKTCGEWRAANPEHVREYRSRPEVKAKRQKSVRKSQQKSPENFLRALTQHLTKTSNYKKVHAKKLNPACLDVQIDFDYLLDLYNQQNGKCAVTKAVMTYKFNDLMTMSIDRIDSNQGYLPGNVQLVCQWVNTAKKHYPMAVLLNALLQIDIQHVQNSYDKLIGDQHVKETVEIPTNR